MVLCGNEKWKSLFLFKLLQVSWRCNSWRTKLWCEKITERRRVSVFVTLPTSFKTPKGAKPGDTLLGEIRYLDKADAFVGDGLHPSATVVKAVVPKAPRKIKVAILERRRVKNIQVRLASWHLKN